MNNVHIKFELNLKISRTRIWKGYCTPTKSKLIRQFSALEDM